MKNYELRLYKRSTGSKALSQVVDQYLIEAKDDADAVLIAKRQQIPTFDNSDFAVLYGPDGSLLWRLDL